MTKSAKDNPSQAPNSSITTALMGVSGIVIGVGGYLTVMLLSGEGGWWTPQYIVALLTCGAVAVILGVMTIFRAERSIRWRIALRILGILSIVAGSIILSLVISLLILMWLLSS